MTLCTRERFTLLVSCSDELAVHSCPLMHPQNRDEHWTGLGLDWIRTIASFVEFGLDPDYKSLQNLGSGPDLD